MTLEVLQRLLDASWERARPAARSAWPEPQRMRAADLLAFLGQQRYCAVASVSGAGQPHLAPASFLSLEDGTFWLPSMAGALRVRHLDRQRARLALLVGQGMGSSHTVVSATGPVVVIATADLAETVRSQGTAKLADCSWAECWLRLEPERLLGYSALTAG
ncbi:MAG: pyridoxamine 5'-phosphate oxidase family protein [Candidatus Dormibacteria bacterium]